MTNQAAFSHRSTVAHLLDELAVMSYPKVPYRAPVSVGSKSTQ